MSNTVKLQDEFKDLYGPFFTYKEFRCKCDHCAKQRHDELDNGSWFRTPGFRAFMKKLIKLRKFLGFAFIVTSGYRCPDYNDSLYDNDGRHLDGPHTEGAADILISFEHMYAMIDECTTRKLGLGIKQHGPVDKRIVHIDNRGPRLWTYP